jgi:hypothetical protein
VNLLKKIFGIWEPIIKDGTQIIASSGDSARHMGQVTFDAMILPRDKQTPKKYYKVSLMQTAKVLSLEKQELYIHEDSIIEIKK